MGDMMRAALAEWLRDASDAAAVEIATLAPMTGGAIQENWRLDVEVVGGPRAGRQALVLRVDAPTSLAISHPRAAEYRLLQVARAAGVTVPEPVALCADPSVVGRPFFVMDRVDGAADARALTAAPPAQGLAARLGAELARLHAVRPPDARLGFLAPPPADPARAEIAWLRGLIDELGAAEPALEWGLNHLEARAPAPAAPVLCHRDFRAGNVMVADGRVSGVLDWEFAGWGDPAADLGWLCAPCWRFARPDLAAGGLGTRSELYAGYAALAPLPDDGRVRFWEALSTARWAVIALMQAARDEPNLELALTAHVVPELLVDLLEMTPP